ncbi:MAG: nucleoside triphosphate pyrophosphohydrolase, partial [Plesiomonas sp.]
MKMSEPMNTLLNIMQQLRDPQTGCPWDRKQT